MSWVVDQGILKLRSQIDLACPDRSKVSDGTIGDPAHQARLSDHNPQSPPPPRNPDNEVDAGDFTHDPAHGADMGVIANAIRKSKDRRVAYIIWNRHETGPSHNWRWDPYDGEDPHTNHMHVSVNDVHNDETQDWSIGVATILQQDWDALIWRIDAITHALDTVRGGPTKGEKVELVALLKDIQAKTGQMPDLSGAFTLSGTVSGSGTIS